MRPSAAARPDRRRAWGLQGGRGRGRQSRRAMAELKRLHQQQSPSALAVYPRGGGLSRLDHPTAMAPSVAHPIHSSWREEMSSCSGPPIAQGRGGCGTGHGIQSPATMDWSRCGSLAQVAQGAAAEPGVVCCTRWSRPQHRQARVLNVLVVLVDVAVSEWIGARPGHSILNVMAPRHHIWHSRHVEWPQPSR